MRDPSVPPDRPIQGFFFGNWFYGLCAVALGVEAALQQGTAVPGITYHLLLFCCTVLFYTHAYRRHTGDDERALWYARNHRSIRIRQAALGLLALVLLALALARGEVALAHLPYLCLFPLIGSAYYGTSAFGLRRIGWLKPLLIGVVWAGVTTWHPAVLGHHGSGVPPFGATGWSLFLKNVLFITLLGILFDIKDHAEDHRHALRTLVVQRGLRSTLFGVVLPLVIVGLCAFLLLAGVRGFSWQKTMFNVVPFLAFVAVAISLRRKRSLLYYLVVVDGLLLLKAVCGSVAMHWS